MAKTERNDQSRTKDHDQLADEAGNIRRKIIENETTICYMLYNAVTLIFHILHAQSLGVLTNPTLLSN